VNQKNFADELVEKMWKDGISVDAIHGGKNQDGRLWSLEQFRKGEIRLLIATDVIGRGLDIPKVTHVVVYSMGGVEDYVHRIGRTGRGKDGKGCALVFFEYSDKATDTARELIDVLVRSKQYVPPELQQIADDIASGKRVSKWDQWNKGSSWGGGNDWKKKEWNGDSRNNDWNKSGNGNSGDDKGWKSNSWKEEDIKDAKFQSWDSVPSSGGQAPAPPPPPPPPGP